MDKKKLNKQKIARSFSRSAATYDQVAYLQRDVGNHLFSILQGFNIPNGLAKTNKSARLCLDVGCGTGFFLHKLKSLGWLEHYIGLDIAEGMLHIAARNHLVEKTSNQKHTSYLCGDAERLPLCLESVTSIFSNMALQWCEDLPRLVAECASVLEKGGVMALTTLGPATLEELKAAWSVVDDRVHVNEFTPDKSWRQAFIAGGLTIEYHQKQMIKLAYQNVRVLLKELKLLGAHNVNEGQPQGLTLPKHLNALFNAYQKNAQGVYPATYEVDYWLVSKPH